MIKLFKLLFAVLVVNALSTPLVQANSPVYPFATVDQVAANICAAFPTITLAGRLLFFPFSLQLAQTPGCGMINTSYANTFNNFVFRIGFGTNIFFSAFFSLSGKDFPFGFLEIFLIKTILTNLTTGVCTTQTSLTQAAVQMSYIFGKEYSFCQIDGCPSINVGDWSITGEISITCST